jgi:radical SAM protein with 4Fe4S-binding SPASM domain
MFEFVDELYRIGVRSLIVHPLVLDSKRGYIKWSDENWSLMRNGIFTCLDKYQDLFIKFSEGVGQKEDNNCMVGSDMIAIDASGDYSGCYFFTNMKGADGVDSTILGNVFHDNVYVERYQKFQKAYNDMFQVQEKCKTCDLQNYCYQCPAGNLDTGSKEMFRPDDMCQEIVQLYLDFQKDVYDKHFWRDVNTHYSRYNKEYAATCMTDFGLNPELTPKQNYELIYGASNVEDDNEMTQCFFIQTLNLKR